MSPEKLSKYCTYPTLAAMFGIYITTALVVFKVADLIMRW